MMKNFKLFGRFNGARLARNPRGSRDSGFVCRLAERSDAYDFIENGGIRERMTAARLGRHRTQNEEIAALKAENASLKREIAALKERLLVNLA